MAAAALPFDDERLPWLEPYRDMMARRAQLARRSHGGLVAVAAGLAVLFAAGSGYWLGLGVPVQPFPTEASAQAEARPAPRVKPGTPQVAEASGVAAPGAAKLANPGLSKPNVAIQARATRTTQLGSRTLAPRPPARRTIALRKSMPSPGPAGQVVQLGAFGTQARANAAYRRRLARYPALGAMPRVVVPVITKPHGQVLYVLRLGTSSRQQSGAVCRNLKASGDHCLVIG